MSGSRRIGRRLSTREMFSYAIQCKNDMGQKMRLLRWVAAEIPNEGEDEFCLM